MTQNITIKWFRSIRFKFFILMSAYLFITVVGISAQNGYVFQTLLDRQAQDRVIAAARATGSNVAGTLELWSAVIHAFMHNIESVDTKTFKSLAKGFVNSNREAVAIQIISVNEKNVPSELVFRFTDLADHPLFAGRKTAEISDLLQTTGIKSIQKNSPTKEEQPLTRQVRSLQSITKLPLLQISHPFTSKTNKTTYWAVISVWQERLAGMMEYTSQTHTFLVDDKGGVALSPNADDMKAPLAKLNQANIIEALKSVGTSGFKAFQMGNQPYMSGFSKIPGYPLTAVVERSAKEEYESIAWRIRRTAIFAWIFLLLTLMASYFAIGKFAKAITQVAETTLHIAMGNFKVRTTSRAQDEVGLLSASVNHMAGQLDFFMAQQVEATRREQELKTAQTMQATLFPKTQAQSPLLDVSGYYEPATECAGDWWAYFPLTEKLQAIVICDATGHGASAALVCAMTYSYYHSLVSTGEAINLFRKPLQEVAIGLNKVMCASGAGVCTLTMFIVLFDFEKGEIRYLNAGHPAPFLKSSKMSSLIADGSPVGFAAEPDFREQSVKMQVGDTVILFTDGLLECTNQADEEIKKPKLKRFLGSVPDGSAEATQTQLMDFFRHHVGKHPRKDDVTVVVARVNQLDGT